MAQAGQSRNRLSSRYMAAVYVAIALVLIAVSIRALRPPQPPPPPTAEYAPQALQELKQPPPEQSSQFGHGAGEGGTSSLPSPTPSAGETIVNTSKVKDCASALTQIPDSQSPPCVPYWTGNNGGATWTGVTSDEIRIALMEVTYGSTETDPMLKYFNDRFETYGRTVVAANEHNGNYDNNCGSTPPTLQSQADHYAAMGIFAALGCGDNGGIEYYFYDRLAQHHVLSIPWRPDVRYASHYQQYAPYEWNYTPPLDSIQDYLAGVGCQLQGRAPSYTTANPLWPKRVFGLVWSANTNAPPPDVSEIEAQLAACGIKLKDALPVTNDSQSETSQDVVQSGAADVQRLETDGVTTVICICHISSTTVLTRQSTAQSYYPEWMVSSFGDNDQEINTTVYANDQQWAHMIGVSDWNKYTPWNQQPWYAAEHEEDPTWNFPQNVGSESIFQDYDMMLLFFSGIQMAGPILTPYTFQEGLWRTHFPNPASPIYEGTAGFNNWGVDDHTMVKDAALYWWSNSAQGPNYHGAAYCYLHNGLRVVIGRLPTDPSYYNFQQPPCST